MGATVQETVPKTYTDSSGMFFEGMTRKDAQDKFSIFCNVEKQFAKIDKDGDGVLSKSEITEELDNDVKAYKDGVKWMSGLGIFNGLWGMATHKKVSKKSAVFSLGITLWCLGSAIYDKLRVSTLEKRIVQGCN